MKLMKIKNYHIYEWLKYIIITTLTIYKAFQLKYFIFIVLGKYYYISRLEYIENFTLFMRLKLIWKLLSMLYNRFQNIKNFNL